MEIALLTKDSLRIKGKHGSLVVGVPGKTEADAALLLNQSSAKNSAGVEGSRLTIYGPGEYEVAGIKVVTVANSNLLVHTVKVDSVTIIVGDALSIAKVHDKLTEAHILAAHVDEGSIQEVVTALAPRVVVLYGEKAQEEAKSLGKEVKTVGKYQSTADKLPADMEVVVLG